MARDPSSEPEGDPEPERSREQQALRESEQRFSALVQGAFEGLQLSVNGTIVVANEALARLVRCPVEQLVGRSGFDFCTPDAVAIVREHIRAGDEAPYEIVAQRADGTTFPCEVLGRNILYAGVPARLTGFRDLTERHRLERERGELEEQMRQAQKLESLGMLAGGIAHDFNNVLMAVLANAELALRCAECSGSAAMHVGDIRTAALRGRELTRQLLNYAAQGPLTMQRVDLGELLRDTVALLGVSIAKTADLSLRLPPAAAVVEGDPGQLRQLVMNLVINASEALAEQPGRIEVQIEPVHVTAVDHERGAPPAEIPAGCAILLRVSDTGQGMDEATRRRIFDPFFTTKPTGRGLGLASVFNIVRGHRGAISVQSELGAGTQFSVWLRQSDGVPSVRPVAAEVVGAPASRGLALVVDDEPMLRALACEALGSFGFETVTADDGVSALQAFHAHRDRLSLVLLDLTMPRLSGIEVLRRMREAGARVPVLCASGYSADRLGAELEDDPHTGFVAKPYSLAELRASVDALLAQGAQR